MSVVYSTGSEVRLMVHVRAVYVSLLCINIWLGSAECTFFCSPSVSHR